MHSDINRGVWRECELLVCEGSVAAVCLCLGYRTESSPLWRGETVSPLTGGQGKGCAREGSESCVS